VGALELHGLAPGQGEMLVTGAAGGVGSVAVAVLGEARLPVWRPRPAGRPPRLSDGSGPAAATIDAALAAEPKRPLDASAGPARSDAVGGMTLAMVLTQLRYRASVAHAVWRAGVNLPTTVMPFLLRASICLGIDW